MSIIKSMIMENQVDNFNTNEHFIRLHQGDKKERNIIVKQWLALALKIAKSFEISSNSDIDEYFAVAVEGLINAVNKFDPLKKIEFSTYATVCIRNEIIKFIKANKRNEFASLDDKFDESKESSTSIIDFIVDENDGEDYAQAEIKMDYEFLLLLMKKVLTERELEILKLRFGIADGECWTYQEIAHKFDLSSSYEIIKNAIAKIQNSLFSQQFCSETSSQVFQTLPKQKKQLVNLMKDKMADVLTENEAKVLSLRFGLVDGKIKTQAEVNKILGLSTAHIGELERKAITKLKVASSKRSQLANAII